MIMSVILGDFVAFIYCVMKLFENKKLWHLIFDEHPCVGMIVVIGLLVVGIWIFEEDWFKN